MAWSTSAPSLPSGASWSSAGSASMTRNAYSASINTAVARGSGNTFYIRLQLVFSAGSYGDYTQNAPRYLQPGGYYVGGLAGGITHTFYYTGSASSGSLNVSIGDSSSGYQTGDARVSVTIPARLTYPVTYNGNGATGGSTGPQTHTSGTPTAILANGFTRKSYRFVAWNTAADGTGTAYAPGDSYNANAALALYAIWERADIPVFVNDGGTIRRVAKAWSRDGDAVREAAVWLNAGGTLHKLE